MKKTLHPAARCLLAALILAPALLFAAPDTPIAKAGYFNDMYNGIKDFSELPSDINKLKEDYNSAALQLEQAQSSLEDYRQQSESLKQQNEQLAQQNRQLAETVNMLKDANEAREATSHKLRIMLYTALGLFAGYFVFLRVVRFKLRK
ncbi:hypothetical protein [Paenibacillus caui]|uniref:hypothetical protein n=1 Tax=Paenibacillus caui TaxID=2873927 RepID=UPI001F2246FE|nr:hypothetical protein [Paenibacillus caui]